MGLEERPAAPVGTNSYRVSRPAIVGPEVPQAPFPILLSGPVQHGFGRGGKDLGCPTANLPDESITPMSSITEFGVYYGYAQVAREMEGQPVLPEGDGKVLPMVMSLGKNPFYNNEKLSAEIHIMHDFKGDFYGYGMKVMVLGYIRPELNYISRGKRKICLRDIETDKQVALRSLSRPGYSKYQLDAFFS
ncbi:riboflavin kinase, partial [Epithele typhae]|uniref:riboflavin kinase n=1 Tax=Epithele typhae TaxID=378194 RepID=UPI002007A745